MRILVTGASSFIGAHLCRAARAAHEVVGIYSQTPLRMAGVDARRVDLGRPDAAQRLRALAPELVVHLAYKVKGGPEREALNRGMMDAVLALDLPVIYASSTVVHWPQPSLYREGRREDEARLLAHPRPWAVLRPCAPFGPALPDHRPHHRESFHTLAALVRRSPVVPVIGDGAYLRQPLYVGDLSEAILGLIQRGLPRRAFDAGGAEALSMSEIVDTLAAAMGRRVRQIPLPKALFTRLAPLSRDFDPQLIDTLDVDDLADPQALAEASGWRPRGFRGAVAYLVAPS